MIEEKAEARLRIFRAADAPTLQDEGCMTLVPFSPVQLAGMQAMAEQGYGEGEEVRVLVNIPGFSLTHIWFKKDFPLPLHSHDVDCLYHIVAGSLRLGTEELGARDSFFIPRDLPYTYKAGPDGVELLEIRHANQFHFRNLVKGEGYWARAVETCASHREEWKAARRPTLSA